MVAVYISEAGFTSTVTRDMVGKLVGVCGSGSDVFAALLVLVASRSVDEVDVVTVAGLVPSSCRSGLL